MATWTDGAAYAPRERPYGFATPEVAPLEPAEARPVGTPGPTPPPNDFTAPGSQVPLEQVVVVTRRPRDPSFPFTTASAALTSAPVAVWGVRDPRTPFPTYDSGTRPAGPQVAELPPPTGTPLLPPSAAPSPSQAWPPPGTTQPQAQLPPQPQPQPQPQHGQAWPPPGSVPPQGAYPPPYWDPTPQQPQPGPDKTSRSLLGIGLGALALGVLFPVAASWLLLVSGLLFSRTRSLTGALGGAATITGVVLLSLNLVITDTSTLAVLACLGFGIWAAYSMVRRPRPRR